MQPFQCDLAPQRQETHRTTHTGTSIVAKHIEGTKRPQPQPPHTRGSFHRRLQPLYTEKHTVSCSGFLPTDTRHATSCSHYNAVRSSKLANLHLSTHRTTPEHQMTTVMQPFQCDLQAQIPKHPITTHTQAHPKQLEATVTTAAKKKGPNRPQPQPPHRRGTFHRRLQPLYTEKHKVSCSGFLPKQSPCNIMQPLQCGSQQQLANLHLDLRTEQHQNTK